MSLLSDTEIERLCSPPKPLVDPFLPSRLKPASYDLVVGAEYFAAPELGETKSRLYRTNPAAEARPIQLAQNCTLAVEPNSVCFILTDERINMPRTLAASLALPLGLVRKGLILPRQPSIDPGYSGRIVAMLYNLSNKTAELRRGEHILSIEFYRVGKVSASYADIGDNKYMGLESLEEFLDKPVISALQDLRERQASVETKVEKWQGFLTLLSPILLAVLTLIVGVLAVSDAIAPDLPESIREMERAYEERVTEIERRLDDLSQPLVAPSGQDLGSDRLGAPSAATADGEDSVNSGSAVSTGTSADSGTDAGENSAQ